MLNYKQCVVFPDKDKLLEIIEAQSEITKAGPDLGTVMSLVTTKAQSLLNADGATVELAEQDEMVYRAVSGSLASFLGLRLKKETSLSGMCVSKQEILYSEDTYNDERVDKAACVKVNARSMAVVPLIHSNTCVGVLKVISSKQASFGDADICCLSLITDMLAASMFHAANYAVDELFIRATKDSMTQLSNRSAFFDNLRKIFDKAVERSHKIGIVIIDMDGLKTINDTYGHRAGDAAITEFAGRLKDTSGLNDRVARLGGDEFGIIIESISERDEGESLINRLYDAMKTPLEFEDKVLRLNASMGLAIFPDDATHIQELIELADRAMYEVKRQNKLRQTNF
ncbi:MAG: sensor domain-containing diguanylate cyclase [Deferribacterales bacterium]